MPFYDLFFVAVILSLITLGYTRGSIPLMISALTWYGSMVFSVLLYPEMKGVVDSFLNLGPVTGYITLILNYLVFSVALFFITQPFLDARQGVAPGNLDRLIGLAFGLVIGIIVLASFELAVIKFNSNSKPKWLTDSSLHSVSGQALKPLNSILGDNMSKMFYDLGVNKASL